ncbi:MAG: hypothetical protein RL235_359 [Chlamydiota bacterium]
MSTILWSWLGKFFLLCLSLRYRVRVKGLQALITSARSHQNGVLFLPNHPALMDPLILFLIAWPHFRMRPLVIEYIFRQRLLKPLMALVRAVSVPNFDTSVNQLKIKRAKESIQQVATGLKAGENFVLYPSGRLKSSGREVLGGASGAHLLVQEAPETMVVLVRTTGLWGSSFSRAFEGHSPDLMTTIFKGLMTLLKNGILFCPRRNIEVTFEVFDKRPKTRVEFNRNLEQWYNRYPALKGGKSLDIEPLRLISYAFWTKDLPEIQPTKTKERRDQELEISEETKGQVYGEIRKILDHPNLEIEPEMNLATDLGMDSLNIAELITFLTRAYDVEELHPEDIDTVQGVLEVAEGARFAGPRPRVMGSAKFPKERGRQAPALPVGRTIGEAFLNCADRMGRFVATGDDLTGPMTYKAMKRAALVLSRRFKQIPHERIAVMLPASVGAYVTILALMFARKTVVMLNWTLGPRYLEEMMQLSKAETILTSWRFLERLSHVEFGSAIDQMLFLEDIRQDLSLQQKIQGLLLSFRSAPGIVRALRLDEVSEHDPAVILFTSGTEAVPKGVPLSHENIMANERAAMQCIDLNPNDVLYGILPPFHSFGFSVAGLFPLLAGLKVAFYPDPTDSFALAEGIDRWKITLFCSAPSFMRGLFHAAKPEQLESVRLFIVGAEKMPPELATRAAELNPKARLIEGYGITECAPILTLTRPNQERVGVGQLLPGIDVCIIHPETRALLDPGVVGEICVRGPNIFAGYLGHPRTPFVDVAGKSWYATGDLGFLDKVGNLILAGRLKRFTKMGGEMISLGAIEDAILQELAARGAKLGDMPSVAVCADEKIVGKPQLILYTTHALTKEMVNEMLKLRGLSRLIKVAQVQQVPEIPLMGTGKTDYRKLQGLA